MPYHPQTNGHVEVTNRELENILTKIVTSHRRDWVSRLLEAVWAYNTMRKSTIGFTPYELVFGKKPLLPIEFELQTLRTTLEVESELAVHKNILLQLNELDEIRMEDMHNIEIIQHQENLWHDRNLKQNQFRVGEWALLFNFQYSDFIGKLQTRLLGPNKILRIFSNGSVQLQLIDDSRRVLLVNGHRFRSYTVPLTKDQFTQQLRAVDRDRFEEDGTSSTVSLFFL